MSLLNSSNYCDPQFGSSKENNVFVKGKSKPKVGVMVSQKLSSKGLVYKKQGKLRQHFILGGKTHKKLSRKLLHHDFDGGHYPYHRSQLLLRRLRKKDDAVVREKDLFRKEPNFPYLTTPKSRLDERPGLRLYRCVRYQSIYTHISSQ